MTNYTKLFRTLFIISLVVNIFQALPGRKYVPTPKEQQSQNVALLKDLTECKMREWKKVAVNSKRLSGETPAEYLARTNER